MQFRSCCCCFSSSISLRIRAEYDRPGSAHVVILSDDLWRLRFHADRDIVGKTIHLDSESYGVVAVMPEGFNFPLKLGTNALLPTDQM